jgi:hypothetical protein
MEKDISIDSEQSTFFFTELINKIGVLKNLHNLPPEKRKIFPETKEVFLHILASKGVIKLGTNTYFVPGSLSSTHRLLQNNVINADNISLIT